MNISSIMPAQLVQDIHHQTDRGVETKNSSSATGASVKSPGTTAQDAPAHIDYFKAQLDSLLTHYPPFFPAGSYQRIDLIKKIKGIQEEIERSSLDSNLKKMSAGRKLDNDSSDAEISAAIDNISKLRDTLTENNPAAADLSKPGSILNMLI